MRFVHETLAQRVRFGSGGAADAVSAELDALGSTRPMVVGTRGAAGLVTGRPDAVFQTEVTQHVPVALAEATRARASAEGVDALVAVGGGSAIGLAKAVALTHRLPIVAVPTTYAGSEATSVWGLTEDGVKRTGTDPAVLPVAVVYDATLTTSLPVPLSVVSGLNAVAHVVDGRWAPHADPINRALGLEALRALRAGLSAVVADPTGLAGRELCQYGCHLAGVAFTSAGSGLHHKICHALGGTFGLPHAETHAVVIRHVLAFNAPAAPDQAAALAGALGVPDAVTGLGAWCDDLGAPRSLAELGFTEAAIPRAVELILPAVPDSNPRPVDAAALTQLLHDAWSGGHP
ncbi:maleylacetate reductase [Jatrophihabitans sp. YIM 134969]